MNKYLIVGGVATGAAAATRLRRLDEKAQITMIDKGDYVSFSNCALPYYVGNIVNHRESLVMMTPELFYQTYRIVVKTNHEALEVDPEKKEVIIKDLKQNQEYVQKYDKLILAPGATAVVPPFEGLDQITNFVLKTVNDAEAISDFIKEKKPKHMTVIGGGFIGLEMVENLRRQGIKVTLIEALNQALAPVLDFEMAQIIHKEMLDHDVQILLKSKVIGFRKRQVVLESGQKIATDGVVLSMGVRPETRFLKDAALEMTSGGHLVVNKKYQTSHPDIYAGGDAIIVDHGIAHASFNLPLAGPAAKQGRSIADHINGVPVINKGYIGSSVLQVFKLNAAATGLNENFIKRMGLSIDYQVVYAGPFDKVSLMPGADMMYVKLIFIPDTGEILGAQAIGEGNVDKRIDVIATAIKARMSVEELADLELCYAPHFGTSKDVVNYLGYIAGNLIRKEFKQVPFYEIKSLLSQNSQIIDVRENEEYKIGHFKGSIHIPLESLRDRLDLIDKSRPVYLHCLSGQRSYVGTKVLQQLGYDVFNIAGSYMFGSVYEETTSTLYKAQSNPFLQVGGG
jgi:NADPH-dependent 2,4-dienoyl-CoA reductase/sulfur reductase-like enzyme/rhodanese-related sulfurtransferase